MWFDGSSARPARALAGAALTALVLAAAACGDGDGNSLTGPDQSVPRGRTIFGLDARNTLVAFGAQNPTRGAVRQVPITGLQSGETVVGIDFRANAAAAADRRLYALTSGSRLYTVDTTSGAATVVGATAAFTPTLTGTAFGVDFNPTADRVRVHSDQEQDLRINQTANPVAVIVDSTLAYAVGDVNVGQNPNIVGTAYTNSVAPSTATDLFAIDSDRDVLVFLASPNNGRLATRGALGVNTDQNVGFDVFGAGTIAAGLTGATAYATLTTPGASRSRLHTINLATGAATEVGDVNYGRPLIGIAVAP